jgi:hypothetical protein
MQQSLCTCSKAFVSCSRCACCLLGCLPVFTNKLFPPVLLHATLAGLTPAWSMPVLSTVPSCCPCALRRRAYSWYWRRRPQGQRLGCGLQEGPAAAVLQTRCCCRCRPVARQQQVMQQRRRQAAGLPVLAAAGKHLSMAPQLGGRLWRISRLRVGRVLQGGRLEVPR